tara:strand:- start:42 stop:275 length:234 start_codon:yes stop_codon:yes gene_type:complete
MTQLNEEHFEVIEKNKIERYERQKLTYLEDRVKVLEKSIESHAKILARFQMTEGVMHKGEKIAEDPADLFTKMMGGK